MNLILYSKPGCHLCEGLEEKLRSIATLDLNLEIRDITQNDRDFEQYQYEIPVLYMQLKTGDWSVVPRPSPRCSIAQLEALLLQAY